jgi:formylglycine-generating enzyme required for sulfatase activity
MKNTVTILFLLLTLGSVFPVFCDDIKLEVFKENQEMLPFFAVDASQNNRAVADLEKRDIIILVNGRNFREFSLLPGSSGFSKLPLFAAAPDRSGYRIVLPYTAELEKAAYIKIGTLRKNVQLHTLEILKIDTSPTRLTEPQERITDLKRENKLIPVIILDVEARGHGPALEPAVNNAGAAEPAPGAPLVPPAPASDAKDRVLKELESYRFDFKDTASNRYFEEIMKYLRQNRVKDALVLSQRMPKQEGIERDRQEVILQLVRKIERINRVMEEMRGVEDQLKSQPSFFDVAIQSHALARNRQGFWEATFNEGITMVYVPAGEFTMGLPWETGGAEDESPEHKVHLDSYWISKYEITFDQYDRYCQETNKGSMSDYDRGRGKRPVIGVSWEDCQGFCHWLSRTTGLTFRLPSEAQWEKAARGTNPANYPWGNQEPDGDLANLADVKFLKKYLELNPPLDKNDREQKTGWVDASINDGYIFTAPVGSFPRGASPYGVMDLAGNVWEWVEDWYDDDYYQRSPLRNPPGPSFGAFRVGRGGGWDCHPWLLRSTGRAGCDPGKGNDALGFRVVCENASGGSEPFCKKVPTPPKTFYSSVYMLKW